MKTWQFVAAFTFLAACGDDSSSSSDAAPDPIDAGRVIADAASSWFGCDAAPDPIDAGHVIAEPASPWFGCDDALLQNAQVVTVHDKAPQYFSGWEDGQNQRIVDATADLPAGPWRKVYLRLDLECPGGNK